MAFYRAGVAALSLAAGMLALGCSDSTVEEQEDTGEVKSALAGMWTWAGPVSPGVLLPNSSPPYYTNNVAMDIEWPRVAWGAAGLLEWNGSSWDRLTYGIVPPSGSGFYASTVASLSPGSNTILVGTSSAGAYRGGNGIGIWRTTLKNIAWSNVLPLASSGGTVYKIRYRTSTTVYAATSTGLWRSTDAGVSWTNRLAGNITDFVFDPTNTQKMMVAKRQSAVMRTFDAGLSWSYCYPGTGDDATFGNTRLAVDSALNYYALVGNVADGKFRGLYRIQNSAPAGSCTVAPVPNFPTTTLGEQNTWNGAVAVHPTSNDKVYVVGQFPLIKTSNALSGGANVTWTNVTAGLHYDAHAIGWGTGLISGHMLIASDGGVYNSSDTSWWESSFNKPNSQSIQDFDVGTGQNPTRIWGARWDCGVFTGHGTSWSSPGDGDAVSILADVADQNRAWVADYPGGCRGVTTDGGVTWAAANTGLPCTGSGTTTAQRVETDRVPSVWLFSLNYDLGRPFKSTNG
ncbi:MAG TPA: hypothetical protein VJN18_07705, partial [Polyangiaceae bacterium]|nr:hypothetical protein [Polyangiaceae bacterium]